MNPSDPTKPPGNTTPSGGTPPHVPQNVYPTPRDTSWHGSDQLTPNPATPISAPETTAPQFAAPPPKKKREGWRSVASTVFLLILAPLIALSITAFGFQSYQVDGASMETTLSSGDRLIVNKVPRTWSRITGGNFVPKRGEVVIFNHTALSNAGGPQKQLIKRVIGLPGESVLVTNGNVSITNSENPNGYDPDLSHEYQIKPQDTPGEIEVSLGDDEIFVIGDNRNNSEDSRYFGPIKVDQIVGVLSLRIMPVDKIEKF